MSNRRLRKLAGLTESISEDPAINRKIVAVTDRHSPEEQTKILDALEGVKDAGTKGISASDWATHVRNLHPDPDFKVGAFLTNVVKEFAFVIKRLAPKLYGWVETAPNDDDDIDPAMKHAVRSQVDLTYDILETMREMGEFTKTDLIARVGQSMPQVPRQQAAQFVDHLLGQFAASLQKIGPDRYRMKPEKPNTTGDSMNRFRDIANRYGAAPDDDYDWRNPKTP